MLIRDMLKRIPELAAEVDATRYAPNPSGHVERHPLTFESRPPMSIEMFEALRPIDPDSETDTPLWHLAQAVKAAWQELYAAGVDMSAYPAPAAEPSYATESGWLLLVLDEFLAVAEPAAIDFLAGEDRHNPGEITACYRELSRLAREPRPVRYRCPDCDDVLRVQPGGEWSLCDSGHQHPGPRQIASRVWGMAPVPAAVIEATLRLPAQTLWQWKKRGKVKPAYTDGRIDYWSPKDVLLVMYPDMAEVLDVGA